MNTILILNEKAISISFNGTMVLLIWASSLKKSNVTINKKGTKVVKTISYAHLFQDL